MLRRSVQGVDEDGAQTHNVAVCDGIWVASFHHIPSVPGGDPHCRTYNVNFISSRAPRLRLFGSEFLVLSWLGPLLRGIPLRARPQRLRATVSVSGFGSKHRALRPSNILRMKGDAACCLSWRRCYKTHTYRGPGGPRTVRLTARQQAC